MEYRIWLITGTITVALHAAAWFVFTHERTHKEPQYLQFSMVEASLVSAPRKPISAPTPSKHESRPQPIKTKTKPIPRVHKVKKQTKVTKHTATVTRTTALPRPQTNQAQTSPIQPKTIPETYTAPNYVAAYLHNPAPVYPLPARRRGISGRVLIRAQITADGHCQDVQIIKSSGHRILDETALAAVKKWRFIPATRGRRPVPATVDIPLNFKLHGES